MVKSQEFCDGDSCAAAKNCQNVIKIGDDQPSIIFKKTRGRLGNQLNMYAMMLQFKRVYGYDPYLLKETYDILVRMFTPESLELPVLESSFCNLPKMKFQVFSELNRFSELGRKESAHSKGKMYELYPPQEQVAFVPPVTNEYKRSRTETYHYLRKTLKIHEKYIRSADETFKKVADQMKLPVSKITFVGIHHRRRDITAFSSKAFNEKPPKKSHFYAAMEYFREEYNPVAFLYVSDDCQWGKKNLKNKHNDLFFVSKCKDDNDDDIGHDFALLVHSNHSVTSLGSFSMWSSLLNSGETYGKYGPMIPSVSFSLL